jgi:hypothetical protein
VKIRIKPHSIVTLGLVLSLFGNGIYINKGDSFFPITLYPYYFIVPFLTIYLTKRKPYINKYFIYICGILLFVGSWNVYKGNNTSEIFLKIFTGSACIYYYYFLLIKYYSNNNYLLYVYLKSSLVISFITIFQFISYLIGFEYGYDFRWLIPSAVPQLKGDFRASSIFEEPSYLALMLIPAVFIALSRLIYKGIYNHLMSRYQCAAILAALILSFSSTGYLALGFCLFVLMLYNIKPKKIILIASFSFLTLLTIYKLSPDFQMRLENSLILINSIDTQISNQIDYSSFTLFNNAIVAFNNLKEHPVLGTGLGSHQYAYEKYSLTKTDPTLISWLADLELNKEDANSLFLRLLSETGILGIILFSIFLAKNYIRNRDKPGQIYWLVSNACLAFIATSLLRFGHYYINGLPFFFILYYFNKKSFNLIQNDSTKCD